MIFSGKKILEALTPQKTMPNPTLRFCFDTEKELFRRKNDTEPLLSYRLKGNFRLPLLHLAVALVTLTAGVCMIKKKFKKNK